MKGSRGLKSSSNSSSKRGRHRKRVGTPGGSGIDFEAISGGHKGGNLEDATKTICYEDVSNLDTTPVAARQGKGKVSKPVSRASEAGGQAKGKFGNGKLPEYTHEETSTEEEESGAVRRRKQRLRQKAAAAAVAVAVEAGADTATVASDDREQPENPNGQASNGSEQHKNNSSNGFATGDHAKAAVADGSKTAEERKTGETGKEAPTSDGGKRKRRGQIRAASTAQQAPKSLELSALLSCVPPAPPLTLAMQQIPRYPRVSLTPSGKARCLAEALEEAVSSELEGFLRKRGQTAACKAAVDAAVDVMQEIHRQASDIGVELDPFPGNMKFLTKVLDEERRRQRSRIDEEEKRFAAEEQKWLAVAERNKQAQSAQANNCKAVDSSENEAGGAGARLSSSGVTTLDDGFFEAGDDPEGEEAPPVDSNGEGAAKRVSDQLLASTNDMLLNAGAIGRCLQEMGAGFADAQEAKERLGRVYKQFAFRNYPNASDPKTLIASMLQ